MAMKRNNIINTLELVKAAIEWDYPLDYAVAIDSAINDIRLVDKAINTYGEVNGSAYISGLHDGANLACVRNDHKLLLKVLEALEHFNDKEHANEHFMFGIETAKEIIQIFLEEAKNNEKRD